jgi:hypothetical protein
VSVAEVQGITHGTIAGRTEAPLGPTCIYRLVGKSTTDITLVVESIRPSQLAPQVAKARRLTVARHPAYCVTLGTQMLFVQLSGGRVLHVTASCPVAQRLAAAALKRLSA